MLREQTGETSGDRFISSHRMVEKGSLGVLSNPLVLKCCEKYEPREVQLPSHTSPRMCADRVIIIAVLPSGEYPSPCRIWED